MVVAAVVVVVVIVYVVYSMSARVVVVTIRLSISQWSKRTLQGVRQWYCCYCCCCCCYDAVAAIAVGCGVCMGRFKRPGSIADIHRKLPLSARRGETGYLAIVTRVFEFSSAALRPRARARPRRQRTPSDSPSRKPSGEDIGRRPRRETRLREKTKQINFSFA